MPEEPTLESKARSVRFHGAEPLTLCVMFGAENGNSLLSWKLNEGRSYFGSLSACTTSVARRSGVAVCNAVGVNLPRENLWFGHPDCSNMTTILVHHSTGRVINLIPADAQARRFWKAVLDVFGGIGSRGESDFDANVQRLSQAYAQGLARQPRPEDVRRAIAASMYDPAY